MKRLLPFAITAVLACTQTSWAACLNNLATDAPNSRFTVQAGTATDSHTGLMWLRCSLGQKWSESLNTCTANFDVANKFTWNDALTITPTYQAQGFDDWRLPNKNELSSIVDRACTGPAVNETIFPGTLNAGYWSSTPGRREEGYAWHVDFTTGIMLPRETEAKFGVYLVRDL